MVVMMALRAISGALKTAGRADPMETNPTTDAPQSSRERDRKMLNTTSKIGLSFTFDSSEDREVIEHSAQLAIDTMLTGLKLPSHCGKLIQLTVEYIECRPFAFEELT